jgi:hypothetical protein
VDGVVKKIHVENLAPIRLQGVDEVYPFLETINVQIVTRFSSFRRRNVRIKCLQCRSSN